MPANYHFSSSEAAFLQRNFHTVILQLLPWQLLTAKSGFAKALADDVRRRRKAERVTPSCR
jgi:hypothetical protein